jgi:glutamyl-tRNA synthetase
VREAASAAAAVDWNAETWATLTGRVKEATGKSGRALFRPLRLALTGRESGPEMAAVIQLLGKDRTIRRLEAAARR